MRTEPNKCVVSSTLTSPQHNSTRRHNYNKLHKIHTAPTHRRPHRSYMFSIAVFTGSQILFITAVAVAWLFSIPHRGWHKDTHDLMQKLSDQDADSPRNDEHISAGELKRRIAKLPPVVQRFMESVLFLHIRKDTIDYDDKRTIPMAKLLRIDQEGTFLLNNKWVPFKATQEFSTRPQRAGFVWDAVMVSTPCLSSQSSLIICQCCFVVVSSQKTPCFAGFIPIHVRDAYITGMGGVMKAQLPGGISLMNMKDTQELNQGELMRWIAEAVLFPMSLLPDDSDHEVGDTKLKWTSYHGNDNAATLEFEHESCVIVVQFHFDPTTHMIHSIFAQRPRTVGKSSALTHWEGNFRAYEVHGGLLVPTEMEVGWQLEDNAPLELYFRCKNSKFIYLMSDRTRHCSEGREQAHDE